MNRRLPGKRRLYSGQFLTESQIEGIREKSRRFWKNNSAQCARAQKKWRKEHPEIVKKGQRKWAKLHPEAGLLYHATARAKKHGLPFNITVQHIQIPRRCPVLGLTLQKGCGKLRSESPTIDQIRVGKGYVPGNVRVISYRANLLKSNATIKELRAVLKDAEAIHETFRLS